MLKKYFSLRFLLNLLFVSSSITAWGQDKYLICLDSDDYIINDRKFFISKAIDNRLIKNGIGIVNKGFDNIQIQADLCESFEQHLTCYFTQSLPQIKEEQINLIVVVQEFKIEEKFGTLGEKGSTAIHFVFCTETDNKLMKVFEANSHIQNSGVDVTKGHETRIKKGIFDCIRQVYKADLKPDEATEMILNEENRPEEPSAGIKGIYMNFEELIHNTPSNQSDFSVHPKNEFFYAVDRKNGKMYKKAYGFSDGKYMYINQKNYSQYNLYAKILTKGRYLAWIDHYVSNSEAVIAGVTLGNSGYKTAASGFDLVILDTETGVINVMDKVKLGNLIKQDPVLYQEYKQANIANNVARQLYFIRRLNKFLQFSTNDDR